MTREQAYELGVKLAAVPRAFGPGFLFHLLPQVRHPVAGHLQRAASTALLGAMAGEAVAATTGTDMQHSAIAGALAGLGGRYGALLGRRLIMRGAPEIRKGIAERLRSIRRGPVLERPTHREVEELLANAARRATKRTYLNPMDVLRAVGMGAGGAAGWLGSKSLANK